MSFIPLFLFLFLLHNFPTTSFALLIKEKRERQTEREEKDWGISVHHVVRDRGSPCCRRSAFTMHYHVRRPTATHPPPHHQAGSNRLVLFFFFFFFFFIFACSNSTLFYKNWNFFCVLCLDYVRNGVRSVCSFFFFFFLFFFFIFASSDSTLF